MRINKKNLGKDKSMSFLLIFWDKENVFFLLILWDGGSIYIHKIFKMLSMLIIVLVLREPPNMKKCFLWCKLKMNKNYLLLPGN